MKPLIIVTLVCLIIWAAVMQSIIGDSRQRCEETTSTETCSWELK